MYLGVVNGYQKIKQLLQNKDFSREKIRERVVAQVQGFQDTLTRKIFSWLVKSGIANSKEHQSKVRMSLFGPGTNKGKIYMNFFTKKVCDKFSEPILII
jgi:hypothetical protein